MKRPGPLVWLFGNPLTVIALVIAAMYFIYQWWSNQGSPVAALIAFLVAGYSAGASDQILKYQQWKREWDAMEGRASGPGIARFYPALRIVFGLSVWCVFAFFALQPSNDPAMHVASGLFWIATLIMIGGGIVRQFRRRKPAKQTVRDVPVTLCVPVSRNSPTVAQAFAALPDYCHPLFSHQSAPAPRQ
jgi:hypothetical protein